jgi:hypothetical protein
MRFCSDCGHEVQADDRFCEECGKPLAGAARRRQAREQRREERRRDLDAEREATERYFAEVGSRHPHIWPVTALGSLVYLLVIGGTALGVYVIAVDAPELARDETLRFIVAGVVGASMWLPLTLIRYGLNPRVRPSSNPAMMGSRGDFWVFLIGIPMLILAIIRWVTD